MDVTEAPSGAAPLGSAVQAMTCGVAEFAGIVGIGEGKARELVSSPLRPPGFYAGNQYRVFRDGIREWLADISRTGRQPVVI